MWQARIRQQWMQQAWQTDTEAVHVADSQAPPQLVQGRLRAGGVAALCSITGLCGGALSRQALQGLQV